MLMLMKKIKPRCNAATKEEKIDRNNKTEYWTTSIKEVLIWLPFLNIIQFTADKIENLEKTLTVIVKDVLNV